MNTFQYAFKTHKILLCQHICLLIYLENRVNTIVESWGHLLYFLHPVLSILFKKQKHIHLKTFHFDKDTKYTWKESYSLGSQEYRTYFAWLCFTQQLKSVVISGAGEDQLDFYMNRLEAKFIPNMYLMKLIY